MRRALEGIVMRKHEMTCCNKAWHVARYIIGATVRQTSGFTTPITRCWIWDAFWKEARMRPTDASVWYLVFDLINDAGRLSFKCFWFSILLIMMLFHISCVLQGLASCVYDGGPLRGNWFSFMFIYLVFWCFWGFARVCFVLSLLSSIFFQQRSKQSLASYCAYSCIYMHIRLPFSCFDLQNDVF